MRKNRDLNAAENLNEGREGSPRTQQTLVDMTALPQYDEFLRQLAWMKQETKE